MKRKFKRKLFLLIIGILPIAFVLYCSAHLKQTMIVFAQNKGNTMLAAELQTHLYETILDKSESYVTVDRNASGRVTSIRIHSTSLALLASQLSVELMNCLQNFDNPSFGIPLGNLTGSALLSGRGPLIPVRPIAAGSAASELQSTFESAGINQTLHRIILHFAFTVQYIAPMESYSDTIYFDLPIAETLIVGEVPILYQD